MAYRVSPPAFAPSIVTVTATAAAAASAAAAAAAGASYPPAAPPAHRFADQPGPATSIGGGSGDGFAQQGPSWPPSPATSSSPPPLIPAEHHTTIPTIPTTHGSGGAHRGPCDALVVVEPADTVATSSAHPNAVGAAPLQQLYRWSKGQYDLGHTAEAEAMCLMVLRELNGANRSGHRLAYQWVYLLGTSWGRAKRWADMEVLYRNFLPLPMAVLESQRQQQLAEARRAAGCPLADDFGAPLLLQSEQIAVMLSLARILFRQNRPAEGRSWEASAGVAWRQLVDWGRVALAQQH